MVTVLGVYYNHPADVHETGATIVRDGKIVAAINQDRISGIKHDGSIAIDSIKEVIRIAQIRPEEIDAVAIPFQSPEEDYLGSLNPFLSYDWKPANILRYPFLLAKKRLLVNLLGIMGINAPIHYVPHHKSHNASTYYPSGFKKATGVIMDGMGDFAECVTVWDNDEKRLNKVSSTRGVKNSPGFYYAKATVALGFKANDGEGKCVHPDTPIVFSDGSVLPIKDVFDFDGKIVKLSPGEEVKHLSKDIVLPTLNKKSLKLEFKSVNEIFRQKYKGRLVKIRTASGRWATVTPVHKLITNSGSLLMERQAQTLTIGDKLLVPDKVALSDIFLDEVLEIKSIDYDGYIYDFIVPDNHNFVGGFGPMILHNTMGLACYGDPNKLYDKCKDFLKADGMHLKGNFGDLYPKYIIDFNDKKQFAMYRYLGSQFLHENPFVDLLKHHTQEDVAAVSQKVFEDAVVKVTKAAIEKTGDNKVVLAGGAFLNVKVNMMIKNLPGIEDVFVFPNPGDAGVHTGAALEVCKMLMEKQGKEMKVWKMEHPYFGSSYSNEEIEEELAKYGLSYQKLKDPSSAAADLVAEGKVIGWFQGASEYGPRALGNRSVIADPRDPNMKERINKHLKKRDWFMPFCPSLLNEARDEYLVNACESPFMIMAFEVPKEKQKDIPAVVHVDGTVRPQTVRRDVNERYWDMIKHFEKNTGVPIVLNTSFNRHGLPTLRTPAQALDHLVWGAVDHLVIGNFSVERKFVPPK